MIQKLIYQNSKLAYGLTKEKAGTLRDGYVNAATKMQEPQIMLAGYRTAEWVGGFRFSIASSSE